MMKKKSDEKETEEKRGEVRMVLYAISTIG